MLQLNGTQTLDNLWEAFKTESDSSLKFKAYATVAEKEGRSIIANVFKKISHNDLIHAKSIARYLKGYEAPKSMCENVQEQFLFGNTESNMIKLANGNMNETIALYAEFAEKAYEEKFPEIASLFNLISSVEQRHDKAIMDLIEKVKDEYYYESDEIIKWLCTECGYIYNGYNSPEFCPLCYSPQKYFVRVSLDN